MNTRLDNSTAATNLFGQDQTNQNNGKWKKNDKHNSLMKEEWQAQLIESR